ncbi:ABC transporter ATP-binding protein [Pseudonocardia ailaonensis]|uniref:ABC transporter ATP-binding protein n=2 Tax=Pseudonocardia ailaonensis TaxID=367279 RepID=A0ABN2MQN4_9PSEU
MAVKSAGAVDLAAAPRAEATGHTAAPAFRLRDLVLEYREGTQVVRPIDGVDLEVPQGEFTCILGPSGHGKSTLLRCLAGLIAPAGGTVEAAGEQVSGPGADRGMVFQQDAIPMWLRVEDNVAFGPRMRGVPPREYRERVDRLITEVGLDDRRRAWPRQLSGGMRKRVAIAAVFANDPDVLLMDEPFSALDFFTRSRLQNLLLQLWAETGKTICFVTHDIDEALVLADRIVVVKDGGIAMDVPVAFPRPRGEELRALPEAQDLRRELLDILGEG